MPSEYPYQILLYYLFTPIEDPETFTRHHLEFCQSLHLCGRIIIASEGINGTVSGTIDETNRYTAAMKSDPRFHKMEFKIDPSLRPAFRRLSVKQRDEIVTIGLPTNPSERTGKYLEPEEFYDALSKKDTVIIDARNDYEYDMGHFRGAIRPEVSSFKEFPDWVRRNLAQFKDKTILTYCTGGIRCEKFTGFLLDEGFHDVYQLHGGIVEYGKHPKMKGRLFDGKCFVFDERISIDINTTESATVLTKCLYCGETSDHFMNCAHLDCHESFYACPSCERTHKRSCSPACEAAEHHEYRAKGEALYDSIITPRGLFSKATS